MVVTTSVLLAAPGAMPAADAAARRVVLRPANAQFDYQLGGPSRPAASVGVVTRDRTARAAAGKYSICYVNAYQTPPGEKILLDVPTPGSAGDEGGGQACDRPGYPGGDPARCAYRGEARTDRRDHGQVVSGLRGVALHGDRARQPRLMDA